MSKLEKCATSTFMCFLISFIGVLIGWTSGVNSIWPFLLPLCFLLIYLYCWRIWRKEKRRVLATNKWNNFHSINAGGTANTVSVTLTLPSGIAGIELPETDEIRIKRIKRELGYGEDNQ